MRFLAPASLALVLVMSATGCKPKETTKPAVPTAGTPSTHGPLNHALPRLATLKLWLGSQELVAEVARTPTEVQTGMMFRTNIADNEGMLFIFSRPIRVSFYMRNTIVPLSCAYLDPEGVILEIHDLKPRDETPVEAGSDNVQFVLETAPGWFQRNGIRVGAVARTEHGAFQEINWVTLRRARPR
jgi:hypothetical protein